ncbi:MAG: sugar kinase [Oscillospiraceae bacterium]
MGKVVTFGEIMLRMAPRGYLKFIQADNFDINYTGAEANICVSLSNFGLDTSFVTKLPDNDISRVALSTLKKFGVGVGEVVFGGDRMGTYYLERGASQRPSKVIYDRKYSSISMSSGSDYDWKTIFKNAEWFHFTGITAALSDGMPAICEEACKAAKAAGVRISCDLNYRKNLWSPENAQRVMSALVSYCDVIIGNEEDADKTLGIKPPRTDVQSGKLDPEAYAETARLIQEKYGCDGVAFTLRTSRSASDNAWAGMYYTAGKAHYSKSYDIHMVDRVGGGDSFGAGLIYALISKMDAQKAIEFAVAASCLKQTMEFDFNLATVDDVKRLMGGDGSGRVQR